MRMHLCQRGFPLDEHLLNDAEEVDRIEKRADNQYEDIEILSAGVSPQHEIPLAEEAASRRQPDHGKRCQRHGDGADSHLLIEAAQAVQIHFAKAVLDPADDEEERALHEGMVDDVHHSADEAVHIAHRQTNSDVADLCDRGVRKHAAEVVLRHRHDRADQDTAHA